MNTFLLLWYAGGVGLSARAVVRAVAVMKESRKWVMHEYADALFVATCGFAVFPVLNYVAAFFLIGVTNDCSKDK